MRIIAGTKRGMKLFGPKSLASRPITDRAKEALFSVLYKYDLPEDAHVADLFCGVGSLGLEALSRGARFVTFVDSDRKLIAILERNIEKAGFGRDCRVIAADVFRIGAPVVSGSELYDLVFVDPPYADTREVGLDSPLADLMRQLQTQSLPGAFVIVRTHRSVMLLPSYGPFELLEHRQWGTTAVGIFRKTTDR